MQFQKEQTVMTESRSVLAWGLEVSGRDQLQIGMRKFFLGRRKCSISWLQQSILPTPKRLILLKVNYTSVNLEEIKTVLVKEVKISFFIEDQKKKKMTILSINLHILCVCLFQQELETARKFLYYEMGYKSRSEQLTDRSEISLLPSDIDRYF